MKDIFGHLRSIFGFLKRQTRGAGEIGYLSFKTLFTRFRQVLDDHNRAIEVIADMGDKLGGDYLFDINYIKKAYSELSGAVYSSMQNFDVLTKNKYLKLHDVFERIDNRIKRMIYDFPASTELVIFYDNITWDMLRDVGGKNSNLAEVKNYLKLNVPEGFAITTRAFDEFIKHNGLEERIESLGNPSISPLGKGGQKGGMLNELQNSIINGEMPPKLNAAIDSAIAKLKERFRKGDKVPVACAVRSSAVEEDSEFSFAGQFETILNVPLKGMAVKDAYKRVVASLFSHKAVAYQQGTGHDIGSAKMAVGCLLMVDAAVSGVAYSTNPNGDDHTMIINAAWGLGKSVVEGQTDADLYLVRKGVNPEILHRRIGEKSYMLTNRNGGGINTAKIPDDLVKKSSLTEEQALELSRQAILIEKYFRKPQDIEWAIDKEGRIFILQARPLRVNYGDNPSAPSGGYVPLFSKEGLGEITASNAKILIKDKGLVVQKGIGAGRVFIPKHMNELDNFPKGSVLVARHDSSDFIRVMPYVSAIITDVGTPTSHMASLCREFRVPTIVNAGNATQIFEHGQEITVNADDEGAAIYDGIVDDLVKHAGANFMKMEDVYEFRKKRYILRYISPLNLIDPLLDNFTPEGCKTMHDMLRFIHERSVMELVEAARAGLKGQAAVKLDLPIPTGIMVVDIGGGLDVTEDRAENKDRATFEQVASIPLRAVLKGMMHPGAWHSDTVSLRVNDFLSSMIRMSDITSDSMEYVGYNVAVISREYLNLSLRFGYHFNMLDCYCSENTRNNHIYFRFVGGATDIVKRSRRIQLIASVLKEYGFNLRTKGDLVIARLANIRQDEMENILDQLGRLIAYTRQLDAVLHDDSNIEQYARNFMEGRYEI